MRTEFNAVSYEHSNETSASIRRQKFLDLLSNNQLLNKEGVCDLIQFLPHVSSIISQQGAL